MEKELKDIREIEFNLNNYIGVLLDNKGIEIWLEKINRHVYPGENPETKESLLKRADIYGRHWFQAHDFIKIFGNWEGYYPPFDMNVVLKIVIPTKIEVNV